MGHLDDVSQRRKPQWPNKNGQMTIYKTLHGKQKNDHY